MAKYIVALALLGCAFAEPPVGYSYPSHGGSSYSSLGGSSGHYTAVDVGHQTGEGYYVDPHLLYKIKNILLKDEIQNQGSSQGHGHGHGGHGISHYYGAPAPVYGVPQERVVGIELDHVQQGIQVAQYHQIEEGYASGHSGYSYSDGGHGSSIGLGISSGHGISSGQDYTTIGVPSGSYGLPSPSYGHPH